MIPAHIITTLNAWIAEDEIWEDKPALFERLLRETLQAVREDPALGVVLPNYVLERVEYVENN